MIYHPPPKYYAKRSLLLPFPASSLYAAVEKQAGFEWPLDVVFDHVQLVFRISEKDYQEAHVIKQHKAKQIFLKDEHRMSGEWNLGEKSTTVSLGTLSSSAGVERPIVLPPPVISPPRCEDSLTLDDLRQALLLYPQWLCEVAVAAKRPTEASSLIPSINRHYIEGRSRLFQIGRVLFATFVLPHVRQLMTPTPTSPSVQRSILGSRRHATALHLTTSPPAFLATIAGLERVAAAGAAPTLAESTAQAWLNECEKENFPWMTSYTPKKAPFDGGRLPPFALIAAGRFPGTKLSPGEAYGKVLIPVMAERMVLEAMHRSWMKADFSSSSSEHPHALLLANWGKDVCQTMGLTIVHSMTAQHWLEASLALDMFSALRLVQQHFIGKYLSELQRAERERRAKHRPGDWVPPTKSAEKKERYSHIGENLARLSDLDVLRDKLHVPPCMAALLDKGRATRHFIDQERMTMASWLIAMEPLDRVLHKDIDLAVFALGGDEVAIPPVHLHKFVDSLRRRRANRHKSVSTKCEAIVNMTLHNPGASAAHCPYAAANGGDVLKCQRQCGTQVYHPLDHIIKSLDW